MSDYFNVSGNPATSSKGQSSLIRAEFAALSTAFDKLAPLTGHGLEIARINAGGTAQETIPISTLSSLLTTTDDASTNSIISVLNLTRTTSGVAQAGIGTGLNFVTETPAGNKIGSVIASVASNVSGGSESFDLLFKVMENNGAAAEKARLKSSGEFNLPTAGVFTINNTAVLSAGALGVNVALSYLTQVGILNAGSIAAGFGTININSAISGTAITGSTSVNSPLHQIAGVTVLSTNTLGSSITQSSLTKVGALNVGSIATGFGAIVTNAAITGTTVTGTTSGVFGTGSGTITATTGNITSSSGAISFGDVTLEDATYTVLSRDTLNDTARVHFKHGADNAWELISVSQANNATDALFALQNTTAVANAWISEWNSVTGFITSFAGQVTLAHGNLTSATGTIDCDNDNILTTGNITAAVGTFSGGVTSLTLSVGSTTTTNAGIGIVADNLLDNTAAISFIHDASTEWNLFSQHKTTATQSRFVLRNDKPAPDEFAMTIDWDSAAGATVGVQNYTTKFHNSVIQANAGFFGGNSTAGTGLYVDQVVFGPAYTNTVILTAGTARNVPTTQMFLEATNLVMTATSDFTVNAVSAGGLVTLTADNAVQLISNSGSATVRGDVNIILDGGTGAANRLRTTGVLEVSSTSTLNLSGSSILATGISTATGVSKRLHYIVGDAASGNLNGKRVLCITP